MDKVIYSLQNVVQHCITTVHVWERDLCGKKLIC